MKRKELMIIIPLIAVSALVGATLIMSLFATPEIYFDSNCQEGWFKYESEAGIICSKTELTQNELDDIFG